MRGERWRPHDRAPTEWCHRPAPRRSGLIGQHAVKSERLTPSSHLSTKPGAGPQVELHAVTSTHSCTGSRRGAQTPSAATACADAVGRSRQGRLAAVARCDRSQRSPQLRHPAGGFCMNPRSDFVQRAASKSPQPAKPRTNNRTERGYATTYPPTPFEHRSHNYAAPVPISPPARRSPPPVSR